MVEADGRFAVASPPVDPVEEELIETFGTFFERFGFKRNFGRIWMLLYMSPEPLDQQTIGLRLGLSAGLVSSTLNQLEHWGAVRSVSGGRRRLYQAEERLLRTVVSILRKREVPAVRTISEAVTRVLRVLEARSDRKDAADAVRIRRLENVRKVARLYQVLVDVVERLSEAPAAVVRRGLDMLSRFSV